MINKRFTACFLEMLEVLTKTFAEPKVLKFCEIKLTVVFFILAKENFPDSLQLFFYLHVLIFLFFYYPLIVCQYILIDCWGLHKHFKEALCIGFDKIKYFLYQFPPIAG